MRILNLYPHPDALAGSERSLHMTARGLRATGHQVYLVHGMDSTPRTAAEYDGELGSPVLFNTAPKRPPPGLRAAEECVERFVAENRIDLLHIHGYPRPSTIKRLARRFKTVVTVHVPMCPNGSRYLWTPRRPCDRKIGVACFTSGYRKLGCGHLGNQLPMSALAFARGMLNDRLMHGAISRCAAIVAPSQWMRQRLGADGVPVEKIHVVHPGVGVADSDRWAVPQGDPPIVLFVGRLVDFKGPDQLVRASALMKSPHQICFVGDGPMRQELDNLARELGVAGRTQFVGAVLPDAIGEYRRRAAVLVMPSLWPESFGMVGPEAMLTRRPVVAYRVGGIPEWLQPGTGRVVDVGDVAAFAAALDDILANPAKAREIGEAAYLAAQAWTNQRHTANLIEVYEQVLRDSST